MGIFHAVLNFAWFIAGLALTLFVWLFTVGFVAMMLLKIYHRFFNKED
jgi:hypothetical protein